MAKIVIDVPDGCEVKIIRKEEKKETVIRTYQDLINRSVKIGGCYIDYASKLQPVISDLATGDRKNIAASEKVAKSMLAMAMISQLMPYYGGEITKKEWENEDVTKYVIIKRGISIDVDSFYILYSFLAFHTKEQRDEFLECNKQLVKDYLMID